MCAPPAGGDNDPSALSRYPDESQASFPTCGSSCLQLDDVEPQVCRGVENFPIGQVNEGCGDDPNKCTSSLGTDEFPVNLSSGRVETNPITLFRAPTPEGIEFGWTIVYKSHGVYSPALKRTIGAVTDPHPTIHTAGEARHFLGGGWTDNYSDRLLITVRGHGPDVITWTSRTGIVTFNQANGWKSTGNHFELIDRGSAAADGLGKWLVQTTDTHSVRKVWTFEEVSHTNINGQQTEKLGRLRVHSLGGSTANPSGFYGFNVGWTTAGLISQVTDTLGRSLVPTYSWFPDNCAGNGCMFSAVTSIDYKGNVAGSNNQVASLSYTRYGQLLQKVTLPGSYRRFQYQAIENCVGCAALLTRVIAPHTATLPPSDLEVPPSMPGEIVLEAHQYIQLSNGARPVASRSEGPGRAYAYEWNELLNTVTQLDLKQPTGSCPCSAGSACLEGTCYVADVASWDAGLRLPKQKHPTGSTTSTGSGSNRVHNLLYSATGNPLRSTDNAGMRTTTGYDSKSRPRCIVRGDNDDQAFASPSQPDSSACAGPSTAQIIQVEYGANSITKTTPSLLGGTVTEVRTLNPTTLLETSVATTGNTKDINGNVQSQTRVTTTTYDAFGRVIETNGPLLDSDALDKTEILFHTTYSSASPFDYGQVSQVRRYVGTSSSSFAITEHYSEYTASGIPRRVVGPNGQAMLFESSDGRTWTIKECASATGCAVLSTATVTYNGEGTLRSHTDADGVCTTYYYVPQGSGGIGYVSAPTRIRRSTSVDSCGADLGGAVISTGEVELRSYEGSDARRLLAITRRMDGVDQYVLSGFEYDRDRRITKVPFENGGSNFSVLYTDVLQTGIIAPGGPSNGAWRTETTVDSFGRPSALQRFVDASNKITHGLAYASAWSPRPTTLTRGLNGAAISTTTFGYDDFGRLVDALVPEAGTPGSPAPTRFEYDVGDRLIKKRIGAGTALVRTDARSYDSLGRLLAVNNDTEHGVTCGSAPSGTPIQDEEYKYDNCEAPDVPAGFACGNAIGRLTIARSIVQCGTTSAIKRGRWYDYDSQGRVKRVAYATVTGTSVGAPAIATHFYTPGGRQTRVGSPLHSLWGTDYTISPTGRVSEVSRGGTNLISEMVYSPFGPLKSFRTGSASFDGSTLRILRWAGSLATNYVTSGFGWTYTTASGPGANVAMMNQTLARSATGLVQTRTDTASQIHSRSYFYDALTRLTGENLTIGTLSWLKGSFLFGNGETADKPADARRRATLRVGDVNALLVGDGDGYVSQSVEDTAFTSGSTQPMSVSRQSGNIVLVHDLLGRRTAEYDASVPATSRRNYTYLPNGQLGSVESLSTGRTYQMRYDEEGHPITITELNGTAVFSTYELFWEGDRLLATQISFATARPIPTATPCLRSSGCFSYSAIRWHYHYLGGTILGATRERVHVDGTSTPELFWFLTDERGLIHRVVGTQGTTYWQAQWDAQGTRSWIGRPQPEMWIPFGLPGQILLADYEAELVSGIGFRIPATQATIKPTLVAAASSQEASFAPSNVTDKSLATRWSSLFSDPQWIRLDLGSVKPLSGVRLTWEAAYADHYQIQVANGANGPWTTVFSTTTGNGGVDEITFSANARYVRMNGTHRATPWGYSLWEFEVFGPWTRPPIAINQWRGYDPLVGFTQPDDHDAIGRVDPEGHVPFRSNSLRFVDPTGSSSQEMLLGLANAEYSFNDNCTSEMRRQTINALGKSMLNIESCVSGLCQSSNFLRALMNNLGRGNVSCNWDLHNGHLPFLVYMRKKNKYIIGVSNDDKPGIAMSIRIGDMIHRTLAFYSDTQMYGEDLVGNRTCLAYQLTHETMHMTLLSISPQEYWGPPLDDPFVATRAYSMSDEIERERQLYGLGREERKIAETLRDCDVCK